MNLFFSDRTALLIKKRQVLVNKIESLNSRIKDMERKLEVSNKIIKSMEHTFVTIGKRHRSFLKKNIFIEKLKRNIKSNHVKRTFFKKELETLVYGFVDIEFVLVSERTNLEKQLRKSLNFYDDLKQIEKARSRFHKLLSDHVGNMYVYRKYYTILCSFHNFTCLHCTDVLSLKHSPANLKISLDHDPSIISIVYCT